MLTAEAEANLSEFAQHNGLTEEQTRACIEEELQRNNAHRAAPASPPAPEPAPIAGTSAEAENEFHRVLLLSKLDLGDATWLVRRIFVTIAENLGINLERAEHLLDDYLDEEEANSNTPCAGQRSTAANPRGPCDTGFARENFSARSTGSNRGRYDDGADPRACGVSQSDRRADGVNSRRGIRDG